MSVEVEEDVLPQDSIDNIENEESVVSLKQLPTKNVES